MNKKICIVQSVYNEKITKKMVHSALKELKRYKLKEIIILKLIKKYDGFIAIGCIIKGETANFDLICSSITNGIMQLTISKSKPIGNGIITSFTEKQAIERISNGKEAANAVIEVLKMS